MIGLPVPADGWVSLLFGPLQFGFLADPIPWWLPPLTVGCGLLLLGPPQFDGWLRANISAWRLVRPPAFRVACLGVLFVGASLIGWTTLGSARWQYAQYLLLVGRAVEGATVINLFVRVRELLSFLDQLGKGSSNGRATGTSGWRTAYVKVKTYITKRIPRILASAVVIGLSMVLFVILVVFQPEQPLLVRIVFVYTLLTFALSIIGTAWILKRLSAHLDPLSFVGVPLCVAGGELYNVPAAFDLFASRALGGPISGATPAVFSTVGWTVGAISALGLLWWSLRG